MSDLLRSANDLPMLQTTYLVFYTNMHDALRNQIAPIIQTKLQKG